MITVKLTVSYDGTDFSGWQRQKNGESVQGVLESAVGKITGEKTTVTGSGRTDAGVHAEGQVASFSTLSTVPPEKFAAALNTVLPPSVKVLKSEKARDGFNARKDAKRKTYRYSVYLSDVEQPLKERYKTRAYGALDYGAMKKAARLFVGEHDFKAFAASGYSAKTTVRTIYSLEIEKSGEDYDFYVTGNGFLYNTVRIIAGAILSVGSGRTALSDVERSLATGERHKDFKTLPAKGLCLVGVEYTD